MFDPGRASRLQADHHRIEPDLPRPRLPGRRLYRGRRRGKHLFLPIAHIPVPPQPGSGRPLHLPTLPPGEALQRMASGVVPISGTGLDLDEGQRRSPSDDKVQLPGPVPPVLGKDRPTPTPEMICRHRLAPSAPANRPLVPVHPFNLPMRDLARDLRPDPARDLAARGPTMRDPSARGSGAPPHDRHHTTAVSPGSAPCRFSQPAAVADPGGRPPTCTMKVRAPRGREDRKTGRCDPGPPVGSEFQESGPAEGRFARPPPPSLSDRYTCAGARSGSPGTSSRSRAREMT